MQRSALYAAIALPLGYFALQLLVAPFYPNYSFVQNAASDLGAPPSGLREVFNLGAVLIGVLGIFGAWGVWCSPEIQRRSRGLALLLGLCLASAGTSAVWAGVFPLPQPLHSQNPFTLGLLLLPVVCAVALWHIRLARVWLVLPLALLLAVLPVRAGLLGIDQAPIEGVLQRILSLAAFMPSAVAGWSLLKFSDHSARARVFGGTSDAQQCCRHRR
jgi:hypothetical membrane protein